MNAKEINDEIRARAVASGVEDDEERTRMAKIGILALIDEATGYQNVRPKDALRSELEKLEAT
jgi:hypothetical protein